MPHHAKAASNRCALCFVQNKKRKLLRFTFYYRLFSSRDKGSVTGAADAIFGGLVLLGGRREAIFVLFFALYFESQGRGLRSLDLEFTAAPLLARYVTRFLELLTVFSNSYI